MSGGLEGHRQPVKPLRRENEAVLQDFEEANGTIVFETHVQMERCQSKLVKGTRHLMRKVSVDRDRLLILSFVQLIPNKLRISNQAGGCGVCKEWATLFLLSTLSQSPQESRMDASTFLKPETLHTR
jgi:hypothetical protein